MADQDTINDFFARHVQDGMIQSGTQGNDLPQMQSFASEYEERHIAPSEEEYRTHDNEHMQRDVPENEYSQQYFESDLYNYFVNPDMHSVDEPRLQGGVAHYESNFSDGFGNPTMEVPADQGNTTALQFGNFETYEPAGTSGIGWTPTIEDRYLQGTFASTGDHFRTFPFGETQQVMVENEYEGTNDSFSSILEYIQEKDSQGMEERQMGGNVFRQQNDDDEFDMIFDLMKEDTSKLEEKRREPKENPFSSKTGLMTQYSLGIEERTYSESNAALGEHLESVGTTRLRHMNTNEETFANDNEHYRRNQEEQNKTEATARGMIQERLQTRVDDNHELNDLESEFEIGGIEEEEREHEINETKASRIDEEDIKKFEQHQIEAGLPEPIIKEMVDHYRILNKQYKTLQLKRIELNRQSSDIEKGYLQSKLDGERSLNSTHEMGLKPNKEEVEKRRHQMMLELRNKKKNMLSKIHNMMDKLNNRYRSLKDNASKRHWHTLHSMFNEEFSERPESIMQLEKSYKDRVEKLKEKYKSIQDKKKLTYAREAARNTFIKESAKKWKEHFRIKEPVPKFSGRVYRKERKERTSAVKAQVAFQEGNDCKEQIIDRYSKKLHSQELPEPIIKYLTGYYEGLYEQNQTARLELADIADEEIKRQQDYDVGTKYIDKLKEANKLATKGKRKVWERLNNYKRKHVTALVDLFDKHATSIPKKILIEKENYQRLVEEKKIKYKGKPYNTYGGTMHSLKRAHRNQLEHIWTEHYKIVDPFENLSTMNQTGSIGKQRKGPTKVHSSHQQRPTNKGHCEGITAKGNPHIGESPGLANKNLLLPQSERNSTSTETKWKTPAVSTCTNKDDNKECKGKKKGKSMKKSEARTEETKTMPNDKEISKLALGIAKQSKRKQHGHRESNKPYSIGKSTRAQDQLQVQQKRIVDRKRKADKMQQIQEVQAQDNVWKRKFTNEDPKKSKKNAGQWRDKAEKEKQYNQGDITPRELRSKDRKERVEQRQEPREANIRKAETQRQAQPAKDDRDANWKKLVGEYERKHC